MWLTCINSNVGETCPRSRRLFIDPLLIAAGISAGTSLLQSGLNYGSQHRNRELQRWITNQNNQTAIDISDANNAMQYRMFNEGNQFNKEMMQAQNEYNSAAAQAARLRQAGINPALAMANGSALGSAMAQSQSNPSLSMPSLSTPNLQAPQFDFSGAFESLSAAVKTLGDNVRADKSINYEIENMRANTKKLLAENLGLENENKMKAIQARIMANTESSLQGITEQTHANMVLTGQKLAEEIKTEQTKQILNTETVSQGWSQLGINAEQQRAMAKFYVDQVAAQVQSAKISAAALRDVANTNASASRDVANINAESLKQNTLRNIRNDWQKFCATIDLDRDKANASFALIQSQIDLNNMIKRLAPINALLSPLSIVKK